MNLLPITGWLLKKWRTGFLFLSFFQAFQAFAQEGWTSSCQATDPSVKEIMVTPCNPSGSANNEYFIFKTGSASFNSKDLGVYVNDPFLGYATFFSSFNHADASNVIIRLNAAVGTCAIGVAFIDANLAVNDVIPPYATVLAFTGSVNVDPSFLINGSLKTLCGSKVYVIFGSGPVNLFPDYGVCGGCMASVQFKFSSAASVYCTRINYDPSKIKNMQGAFIDLQSNGALFYGGTAGNCLPTPPLSCPPTPPDPGFGNNAWNVLTFNQANDYSAASYVGYYVADGAKAVTGIGCPIPVGSFEFNTATDGWTSMQAPSDAVNNATGAQSYTGCYVQPNKFSIEAQRRGFPCGFYHIRVQHIDGGGEVSIDRDGDGVAEDSYVFTSPYDHGPGCTGNFWDLYLGTRSKVTIRAFNNTNSTFNAQVLFLYDPVKSKTPLVVDAGKDTAICIGASFNLGGTPPASGGAGSYIYAWSPATFLNDSTLTTPTSTPTKTTKYSLTVVDTNNCVVTKDVHVTVNPLPNVTVSTNNAQVCTSDSLIFSASGALTYEWSPNVGLNDISSAMPVFKAGYLFSYVGKFFVYTVTGKDANGCVNSTTDTVFINSLPTDTIYPVKDTICTVDPPLTLTGFPGGGYYTIQLKGSFTIDVLKNGLFDPSKYADGTYVASHVYTDDKGCQNKPSIHINVKTCSCLAQPTAYLGPDTAVCYGSSVPLNPVVSNATAYSWKTSGSGIFSDPASPSGFYTPSSFDLANGAVMLTLDLPDPDGPRPCTNFSVSRTITFIPKKYSSLNQTICRGDSFQMANKWYKIAGSYKDSVPSLLTGCDSVISLFLKVNSTSSSAIQKSICPGDSFQVGVHHYQSAGIYVDTLKNTAGCDSVVTTTVSVFKPDTTLIFKTSCSAADTGLVRTVLKNRNGCDSLILTRTTLLSKSASAQTAIFCSGDSIKVGVHIYRTAGAYLDTLKNLAGCDSVISTTVSVFKLDTTIIYKTSCSAIDTGLVRTALKNRDGCDSLILTRTTLLLKSASAQTTAICAGDNIKVGVHIYRTAGSYLDTLKNLASCDSIVSTTVSVFKLDTTLIFKTSCSAADTGSVRTVLKNRNGCDSLILTRTNLLSKSVSAQTTTICSGDSIKVGVHIYRTTGVYLDTLKNLAGCDSVISTTVSVFKLDTMLVFKASCVASDTGLVRTVIKNRNGCDSLILTRTTLLPQNASAQTSTICTGDSIKIGGHIYRSGGLYLDTLKNLAGCDSVISTAITVLKPDTMFIFKTTCSAADTGLARMVLRNRNGCDSLILTRTTLLLKTATTQTATFCLGDSVKVGANIYRTAGVYLDTLKNLAGCDSLISTAITVLKPDTTLIFKTSCSTADTGFARMVLRNRNGCDSLILTQTTLLAKSVSAQTATICLGDSIKVGANIYRTAGVYLDTLKNLAGCDSVISTSISIFKPDTTLIFKTSCSAADTGLVRTVVKNRNGCDSLVLTRTSLLLKTATTQTITFCAGDSIKVGVNIYRTAGTFLDILKNLAGCDSVISTAITVLKPDTTLIFKTSCSAVDTGLARIVAKNRNGCDSVILTRTTLLLKSASVLTVIFCSGDSIKVGMHIYRTAGSYLDTLQNLAGCDSVISTTVSVFKLDTTIIYKTSCSAVDTGLVRTVLKNRNGCDSLILTRTSLLLKTATTQTATFCLGDSVKVGANIYRTAGVYLDTLKNLAGCDSVISTSISIFKLDTTLIFKTSCSAVDTGLARMVLKNRNGCDSLILTRTTLLAKSVSAQTATICLGDSIKVGANIYRTAGVYLDTLKNLAGCDSVISTSISIFKLDTTLIFKTSCSTADTGFARMVLRNRNGCDSLILTRTSLLLKTATTQTAIFCAGDSVKVGANIYRTAGTFLDILKNLAGCDSVISTAITVLKPDTTLIFKTSCSAADTGLARMVLKNRNGCDSLILTRTTLLSKSVSVQTASICAGDSVKVGVNIYRTTGSYSDTLKNLAGCDSVISTAITVLKPDTTLIFKTSCAATDTGLVRTVAKNRNGCDSLILTQTTLLAKSVSAQIATICLGDSVRVGRNIYRTAGVYLDTLKNLVGCDSVISTSISIFKLDTTLIFKTSCSTADTGLARMVLKNHNGCDSLILTRTTLLPQSASVQTSTICAGDSVKVGVHIYRTAGSYLDRLKNLAGCDSVVATTVSVFKLDTTIISKTSCLAVDTGTVRTVVKNRNGCDSLILTRTTLLLKSATTQTVTFCSGDSIKVGGHFYRSTGSYLDTLKNLTGCDSLVSTTVSVFNPDTTIISKTSCIVADTGLTRTILKNKNGCDSLILTRTTFLLKNVSKQPATICLGDSVKVGVHVYRTAGSYLDTLKNLAGCDSVVSTTVTVFKPDTTLISKTSCSAADTGLVKTVLKNRNGCDSLIITRTNLLSKSVSAQIATICLGDSVRVGRNIYRTAGSYLDTMKNLAGCDSVVSTTVSVFKLDTTIISKTSCFAADTGVVRTVMKNRNGCDSLILTRTALASKSPSAQTTVICIGDSVKVGNHIYKLAGAYLDTLKNIMGCDSIVSTTVLVLKPDTTLIFKTSCSAADTGLARTILKNRNGCDSVILTRTTLLVKIVAAQTAIICLGDSIKVGVRIYKTGGAYLDTLKNSAGCDSLVSTTVLVLKPDTTLFFKTSCLASDTGLTRTVLKGRNGCDSFLLMRTTLSNKNASTLTTTICSGDSFRLFSHWYKTTGVYQDSVKSANGCDSLIILQLTVTTTSTFNFNKTICNGDTLKIGAHNYTSAGEYLDTLKNFVGCDSVITTTVSMLKQDTTLLFKTSCSAADTGLARTVLKNRNGCDSLILTRITFQTKTALAQTVIICTGDSVKVGGHIYQAAGIYLDTLKSLTGCDSVVSTSVSISKPDTTFIFKTSCLAADTGLTSAILKNRNGCDSLVLTRTALSNKSALQLTVPICAGDSFRFFSKWYKTMGVYQDSVKNVGGCDSVITLFLTVSPKYFNSFSKTICSGDSIKVGGHIYRTTGTYQDTLKSLTGCDSLVSTIVLVLKLDTTFIYKTSCFAADTGLVGTLLKNRNGCDSLILTRTTLSTKSASALTAMICTGDSIKAGEHIYLKAGVYIDTLKNLAGCDSIITTTVSVFKTDTTLISKTSCSPSDTGLVKTMLKNRNGCDSFILIRTTLSTKNTSTLTATICAGDSARLFGKYYKTTGVYKDSARSVGGCDSVVALVLTVRSKSLAAFFKTICAGDSIKVGPHVYNTAGTYLDTLKNFAGCDSVVTTTVSVFKTDTTLISKTSCSPSDTGLVKTMLKNRNGCDSFILIRTTLSTKNTSTLIATICAGDSARLFTKYYKTTGVYKDSVRSVGGCDSVVALVLTVSPESSVSFSMTICAGDSVKVGPHVYKTAGAYLDTLKNLAGCDSLVSTAVMVLKPDTTLIINTSSSAADTGVTLKFLKNRNGCDSLILTRTNLSVEMASTIRATICAGDSARLFTRYYKTTGMYKDSVRTAGGRDSVVMLVLTVLQKNTNAFLKKMCTGDTLKVGAHTYRTAGTYIDTLKNSAGCDSIITTMVSVLKPDTTLIFKISCTPKDTGLVRTVLNNRNGCDSLVISHTTLSRKDTVVGLREICEGDSLFFKNRWLWKAGIYTDILMNSAGCDSAVELRLTVRRKDSTLIEKTSCRMKEAGTVVFHLVNQFGCDSAIKIHTRYVSDGLKATLRIVKPISCYGAQDGAIVAKATTGGAPPYTFQWSANAGRDSATGLGQGVYYLTATDAAGCDATDSVRLIEPASLKAALSARSPVCFGDSNGIVTVDTVKGGTFPYFIAFNGSASTERISVFPFYIKYLKTGNYPVEIADARHCIFRDTVDVTTKPPLFVDLGPREERLTLGDSVFLKPAAGFPIHSFQWNPPDYLSCPNCLRGFAKPLFSTSYTLTLTDTAGCEAIGKITVFVDKPRKVFIPTAFSPNKDGQNDVLMVYAGQEVALVKTFQVFDRWGEKVFEATNVQPNDERAGWDGTFNGQDAPTGVYVYFAKIVFKDGVEIMYQGDVNIVR